jgi:MoaA/NifB/PqqE/SkfB family radical SAM enzyme
MFKKTINHFMSVGGIQEISISGGEPFLHPNLFEMIEYCKSFGIRVVLFTSGVKRNTHLSQQQLDELRIKIYRVKCS